MLKAFTLAEVLVTLTILGIVATIVVPNVIQQYQKRVTITKLKKAYATLEGAAANIASSTGCVGKDVSCSGILDISDGKELQKSFKDLSGLKIKKIYDGPNIRFAPLNFDLTGKYYDYVNFMLITSDDIGYQVSGRDIRTKEGIKKAFVVWVFTDPGFVNKVDSLPKYDSVYPTTNKTKTGRNVFQFIIWDNFKVEPASTCFGGAFTPLSQLGADYCLESNYDLGCNPESTDSAHFPGNSCTARIVREGWKINY